MADKLQLQIRGGALTAGVKELRQASERHRWDLELAKVYRPFLSKVRSSSMGNSAEPIVAKGFALGASRVNKGRSIARLGIADIPTIRKHMAIEFGRKSWRPMAGKFWLRRLYKSEERRLFSRMATAYTTFLARNEPIN